MEAVDWEKLIFVSSLPDCIKQGGQSQLINGMSKPPTSEVNIWSSDKIKSKCYQCENSIISATISIKILYATILGTPDICKETNR